MRLREMEMQRANLPVQLDTNWPVVPRFPWIVEKYPYLYNGMRSYMYFLGTVKTEPTDENNRVAPALQRSSQKTQVDKQAIRRTTTLETCRKLYNLAETRYIENMEGAAAKNSKMRRKIVRSLFATRKTNNCKVVRIPEK